MVLKVSPFGTLRWNFCNHNISYSFEEKQPRILEFAINSNISYKNIKKTALCMSINFFSVSCWRRFSQLEVFRRNDAELTDSNNSYVEFGYDVCCNSYSWLGSDRSRGAMNSKRHSTLAKCTLNREIIGFLFIVLVLAGPSPIFVHSLTVL